MRHIEFDTKKEADAAAKGIKQRNKDLDVKVYKSIGRFGMKDKYIVRVKL